MTIYRCTQCLCVNFYAMSGIFRNGEGVTLKLDHCIQTTRTKPSAQSLLILQQMFFCVKL